MKHDYLKWLKRELIITLIVKFVLLFGLWFAFFRPALRVILQTETVASHLSSITTTPLKAPSFNGHHTY